MYDSRIALENVSLSGYTIEKCIGRGSSSLCYIAKKEVNGSTYIIKELYPIKFQDILIRDGISLVPVQGFKSNNELEKAKNRFKNEIELSRTLRDYSKNNLLNGNNPYFFSADDHFEIEGSTSLYATYSTFRGDTLKHYIESIDWDILKLQDLLDLFISLAYSIDEIHSAGYIHLDLKPDNIFVVDYGKPVIKLIDLGSSIHKDFYKQDNLNYYEMLQLLTVSQLYTSPNIKELFVSVRNFESIRNFLEVDEIDIIESSILDKFRSIQQKDDIYSFFIILYEMIIQSPIDEIQYEYILKNSILLKSVNDTIRNSIVDFIFGGIKNDYRSLTISTIIQQLNQIKDSLKNDYLHPKLFIKQVKQNVIEFSEILARTKLNDYQEILSSSIILKPSIYSPEKNCLNLTNLLNELWKRSYPSWNSFVVADGGYGKTTLSLKIVDHLVSNYKEFKNIPVYIPLYGYNKLTNIEKQSESYIYNYFIDNYSYSAKIDINVWFNLLNFKTNTKFPCFTFILDGLNEINRDDESHHLWNEIYRLFSISSVQVIIMSRIEDEQIINNFPSISVSNIQVLNEMRIIEYLTKFNLDIKLDNNLLNILRVPLFLKMYTESTKAVVEDNLIRNKNFHFVEKAHSEAEIFNNYIELNIYNLISKSNNSLNNELVVLSIRYFLPFIAHVMERNGIYDFKRTFYNLTFSTFISALKNSEYFQKQFPTLRNFKDFIILSFMYLENEKIIVKDKFIEHGQIISFINIIITFFYRIIRTIYKRRICKFEEFACSILEILINSKLIINIENLNGLQLNHPIYRDILSAVWIRNKLIDNRNSKLGNISILEISSRILPKNVSYHLGNLFKAYEIDLESNSKNFIIELLNQNRNIYHIDDVSYLTNYMFDYKNLIKQWTKIFNYFSKIRYSEILLYQDVALLLSYLYSENDIDYQQLYKFVDYFEGNIQILNANAIRAINYSRGNISGLNFDRLDLTKLTLSELTYANNFNKNNKQTNFSHSKLYLDEQLYFKAYRLAKTKSFDYNINERNKIFYFSAVDRIIAFNFNEGNFAWVYKIDDYNENKQIAAFSLSEDMTELVFISEYSFYILKAYSGELIKELKDKLLPITSRHNYPPSTFSNSCLYFTKTAISIQLNKHRKGIYRFDFEGNLIDKADNRVFSDDYRYRNLLSIKGNRYLQSYEYGIVELMRENSIEGDSVNINHNLGFNKYYVDEGTHFSNIYYSQSGNYIVGISKFKITIFDYFSTLKIAEIKSSFKEIKFAKWYYKNNKILIYTNDNILYVMNKDMNSLEKLNIDIAIPNRSSFNNLKIHLFSEKMLIESFIEENKTILLNFNDLSTKKITFPYNSFNKIFVSNEDSNCYISLKDIETIRINKINSWDETPIEVLSLPRHIKEYSRLGKNFSDIKIEHDLFCVVKGMFIYITLFFDMRLQNIGKSNLEELSLSIYQNNGEILSNTKFNNIKMIENLDVDLSKIIISKSDIQINYNPTNKSVYIYGGGTFGLIEVSLTNLTIEKCIPCINIMDLKFDESNRLDILMIKPSIDDFYEYSLCKEAETVKELYLNSISNLQKSLDCSITLIPKHEINDFGIYNCNFSNIMPSPSINTILDLNSFENKFIRFYNI